MPSYHFGRRNLTGSGRLARDEGDLSGHLAQDMLSRLPLKGTGDKPWIYWDDMNT
jgi:hypothetical protein